VYDQTDERGVPISAGVPIIVRLAVVIGIIVILSVVGMVISASAFGHAWPASTSSHLPL
jgi:hypothetical protein